MNEVWKLILSLSCSGTLFIIVLLLGRPLFRNRISRSWQYYIWLVVIARLILPFTPETSPVGALFQATDRAIIQTEESDSPAHNTVSDPEPEQETTIKDNTAPQDKETSAAAALTSPGLFAILLRNFWLIWLVAALILLIRKITIYQCFVRYVKAGCTEVSDTALLDRLSLTGEQAGVKKPVELYTNSLVSSPLLLGFFRPCIVLPAADLPDTDLQYTLLHELIHCKRCDMFYKWLVQLTLCLHWFNPFVYAMGREINRACELACDEAVIKKLDAEGQRAYGDTLISAIVIGGGYKNSLASVTFNECKNLMKERLEAIMKFKKKSKPAAAASLVLTILLAAGAAKIGAYAAPLIKSNMTMVNSINGKRTEEKTNSMAQTAAEELLKDLDTADSEPHEEDAIRIQKELVSEKVLDAINTCDPGVWYSIAEDGYRYIYFDSLPHNYAWQPEIDEHTARIEIFDIERSTNTYVLLRIPENLELTIFYNSHQVMCQEIDIH